MQQLTKSTDMRQGSRIWTSRSLFFHSSHNNSSLFSIYTKSATPWMPLRKECPKMYLVPVYVWLQAFHSTFVWSFKELYTLLPTDIVKKFTIWSSLKAGVCMRQSKRSETTTWKLKTTNLKGMYHAHIQVYIFTQLEYLCIIFTIKKNIIPAYYLTPQFSLF